jgi:hypothetical protein
MLLEYKDHATNKYTGPLYMIIALYLEPLLDPISQEYTNVLTLDSYPEGPLRDLVIQKRFPELSPFKKTSTASCKYVIYMDLPSLFSYLQTNGYTIEYQQTKIYKHPYLVCLINAGAAAPRTPPV